MATQPLAGYLAAGQDLVEQGIHIQHHVQPAAGPAKGGLV